MRLVTARDIPLAGHRLELPIPGRGMPLQLKLDTVYEGYGGVITYAGIIDGDDGSLVAISVKGDEILGKIHHSEGFTYLIESPVDGLGYNLSVIDQAKLPKPTHKHEEHHDAGMVTWAAMRASGKDFPVQPMSSGGEVRLLVMYTPAVAQQVSIPLLAANIVSSFNQSLSLSGVSGSSFVALAGLRSIEDNLSTYGQRCNYEIVGNMGQRANAFSDLDAWMDVAWADIGLAIVTTEPSYTECLYQEYGRLGGMGTYILSEDYPGHSRPFANVTHTFALADLTAIHEVGHVLNGQHETCDSTMPSYACGYAPGHCNWQTMMGGYAQCGFDFEDPPDQQPTVRIARWSNPNVNYSGEPTGSAQRNMAAALNVNMSHAAGWAGPQAPPPAAPDPISANPFYCFGMNSVQWTAQSGAVEYRLFQSYSPGFSSPTLIYSGPGTYTLINVTSTAYVRAQACNSGGCSPYSQQVTAHYQTYCS